LELDKARVVLVADSEDVKNAFELIEGKRGKK